MTIDASVLENLRDAGCDEGMIERCRRIAAEAALGDALMALCECARLMNIDPELALSAAADRLIARFAAIESKMLREGGQFESQSAEKSREYWDLVKL